LRGGGQSRKGRRRVGRGEGEGRVFAFYHRERGEELNSGDQPEKSHSRGLLSHFQRAKRTSPGLGCQGKAKKKNVQGLRLSEGTPAGRRPSKQKENYHAQSAGYAADTEEPNKDLRKKDPRKGPSKAAPGGKWEGRDRRGACF